MLKAIAVKALLGVGAIGVAGGSAALAGAPNIAANLAATTKAAPTVKEHRDHAFGTTIKLSSTEMTVERQRRDPKTKAVTKDDVTFELSDKTAVHRWGSKDKHGTDILAVAQDVSVRYTSSNGKNVARAIVIRPDHRAGRIVSKDADGSSFTIKNADGTVSHVTTSDGTKFIEGAGKNKKAGSYADLKVGDRVLVLGQEDSHHIFDASVVRSPNHDHSAAASTTPKA